MTTVRGYNFPDTLFYDADGVVWFKKEKNGLVRIGITSFACSQIEEIMTYKPKKVGKHVKKNKSCTTLESAKWAGPVCSPVGGDVLEINTELKKHPEQINQDPYGKGWLLKIQPENWDDDKKDLVQGNSAIKKFEQKMEEKGL